MAEHIAQIDIIYQNRRVTWARLFNKNDHCNRSFSD